MSKNYVDVIIDNKVLTLGGGDKEGYYQQVAAYVNDKISALRAEPGFNRQPKDIQNILISLNIADDYLKSRTRFDEVCALVDKQAKDVYKLKHDLVADKIRIEKLEKELESANKLLAAKGIVQAPEGMILKDDDEKTSSPTPIRTRKTRSTSVN